jgi:peptidoglycan/xylan/chitin deacetylase (PgdA/CDA1 family)
VSTTTLRHAAAGRLRRRLAAAAAAAVLLAACGGGEAPPEKPAAPEEPAAEQPAPEPDADEDAPAESESDEAEAAPEAVAPAVDPAEVGADELGLVPVLMYHQLREDGGSDWDMSPDEFRAELVRLFDSGYVPITTADLARGHIDVPAGHSPVVLTFDDSTRSQARLDETGAFAADTSMGILVEVAAAYDHIDPVASFYVISSSLFGGGNDGPDILAALHDAGVEIGNHSHTHPSLRSIDAATVQEELATNVATVRAIVPDAEVATLSLPLGIYPEDTALAVRGSHGGIDYEHVGVLQVGYNPNVSPFHVDFDGAAIARIQTYPDPAFEFGSAWWLDQLDRGESYRRFVSDGDPDTISFPADRAADLAPAFQDRANPY